jgi:hypothetical protein
MRCLACKEYYKLISVYFHNKLEPCSPRLVMVWRLWAWGSSTLNSRWTHTNFLTFHAIQILTVIVKKLMHTFYCHVVFN